MSVTLSVLFSSTPGLSKTVLRYAVRSTINGDVEMHIDTDSGKTRIKQETRKAGCMEIWDKSCFEEKNYESVLGKSKVKKLMESIKKNKIFSLKLDYIPQPSEDQYSIGLLKEGKKPQYVNCVQTKLDQNPGFKKAQQDLQKIVDKMVNKKVGLK